MTEELKQTINKEIAELPKENQEAIARLDWVKMTEEVGKKHLLNEEEVENLQLETLLVLIGVNDPEFFNYNIENYVPATKDGAIGIARDMFSEVLTPIYNRMEENIKKNLEKTNPDLDQNVNFILSGGNYGVLGEGANAPTTNLGQTKPVGTSSTNDMKDRLVN